MLLDHKGLAKMVQDRANNLNLVVGSVHPTPASIIFFTVDEVRAELKRLRAGKAAGPDGVYPRLLKDCAAQLAEPS